MKGPVLAIVVTTACVLWRVSVSSGQPSNEELIRRAREASNEAIRAHDAEAVASFFTDDYSLVSSANLQITGKDKPRENFAKQFEDRPDVVYVRTPRELGSIHPGAWRTRLGRGKAPGTNQDRSRSGNIPGQMAEGL